MPEVGSGDRGIGNVQELLFGVIVAVLLQGQLPALLTIQLPLLHIIVSPEIAGELPLHFPVIDDPLIQVFILYVVPEVGIAVIIYSIGIL